MAIRRRLTVTGIEAMKRTSTKKRQVRSRTDRMLRTGEGWFFKTREGNTVGPFADELEASTQLEVYIRLANAGLLPEQEGLAQGRSAMNSSG
jgi:hypothetical protein